MWGKVASEGIVEIRIRDTAVPTTLGHVVALGHVQEFYRSTRMPTHRIHAKVCTCRDNFRHRIAEIVARGEVKHKALGLY